MSYAGLLLLTGLLIVGMLVVGAIVAMLVNPKTRWWAVGLIVVVPVLLGLFFILPFNEWRSYHDQPATIEHSVAQEADGDGIREFERVMKPYVETPAHAEATPAAGSVAEEVKALKQEIARFHREVEEAERQIKEAAGTGKGRAAAVAAAQARVERAKKRIEAAQRKVKAAEPASKVKHGTAGTPRKAPEPPSARPEKTTKKAAGDPTQRETEPAKDDPPEEQAKPAEENAPSKIDNEDAKPELSDWLTQARIKSLIDKVTQTIASKVPGESDRPGAVRGVLVVSPVVVMVVPNATDQPSARQTSEKGGELAVAEKTRPNVPEKQPAAEPKPVVDMKPKVKSSPDKTRLVSTKVESPEPPKDDRPDWVDQSPGKVGDVYQTVVVVGPYSTRAECDEALPRALRAAVAQYVDLYLGPDAKWNARLPDGYLFEKVVRATWVETRQHSFAPMKKLYVLLEFDRKTNDLLKQRLDTTQVEERIVCVGIGLASVLAVLLVLYGALKIDLVTEGAWRRYALMAIVVCILAYVALGTLAYCDYIADNLYKTRHNIGGIRVSSSDVQEAYRTYDWLCTWLWVILPALVAGTIGLSVYKKTRVWGLIGLFFVVVVVVGSSVMLS
ncbi:MAG: hypothetical protein JW888_03150 [Pirellulales bacterium]|nr:hypothetical protein [Pirellulales bacterium]